MYSVIRLRIPRLSELPDPRLSEPPDSRLSEPPDPINHVKQIKGQPRQFSLSELVQACYKTFLPDHFGQVEINDSTMLSNKTSTAESCAEDQILERKIFGTRF